MLLSVRLWVLAAAKLPGRYRREADHAMATSDPMTVVELSPAHADSGL